MLQPLDETSWAERSKYKFMVQSMYLKEDIPHYDLEQAVSTPSFSPSSSTST